MKRPEEEAKRWLEHARDEFTDADELRKRDRFYIALFHFQQSAEKALKAYLFLKVASKDIWHTHSLAELLEMAGELDNDFNKVAAARKLDQYYIPTRYPNGLPGGVPSRYYDDPEEAREAMKLSRKVLEVAGDKIESKH